MSRIFKPVKIRGAFWICSIAIAVLLSIPHIGGMEDSWMNGIYDSVCTIILFPILVYLGASGKTTDKGTSVICKFLGDISYPLYIVHYPLCICIMPGCGVGKNSLSPIHGRWLW